MLPVGLPRTVYGKDEAVAPSCCWIGLVTCGGSMDLRNPFRFLDTEKDAVQIEEIAVDKLLMQNPVLAEEEADHRQPEEEGIWRRPTVDRQLGSSFKPALVNFRFKVSHFNVWASTATLSGATAKKATMDTANNHQNQDFTAVCQLKIHSDTRVVLKGPEAFKLQAPQEDCNAQAANATAAGDVQKQADDEECQLQAEASAQDPSFADGSTGAAAGTAAAQVADTGTGMASASHRTACSH
ncbi:hypothetical protein WJX79_007478 [Trebouxia sp. C0005]